MKPAHVKGDTFEQVLSRRAARRSFLKGAASAAALFVVTPGDFSGSARAQSSGAQTLGFASIPLSSADRVVVAENYASHVVVRWGDPLFSDAPTLIRSTKRRRRKRGSSDTTAISSAFSR